MSPENALRRCHIYMFARWVLMKPYIWATSQRQQTARLCWLHSHFTSASHERSISWGASSNAENQRFCALFNVVTSAHSRWHVTSKTKLITFPSMSTVWAHSRLTRHPLGFLNSDSSSYLSGFICFSYKKTAPLLLRAPHRHILSQSLLKTSLSVCTMSDGTLNSGPDSAIFHHALRFISYVIV